MRLIKRMGSLGGLMKMIPGMNKIDDGMLKQGEQQLKKIEAMSGSMTAAEDPPNCWRPNLPSSSHRRRRLPAADVDKVLADFQKMRGFAANDPGRWDAGHGAASQAWVVCPEWVVGMDQVGCRDGRRRAAAVVGLASAPGQEEEGFRGAVTPAR